MTIEEARIQVFDDCNGNCGGSVQILQQRLLLKYKYQIATETAERNTSKQSVQRKLHSKMYIKTHHHHYKFFFFLKWSDCRETESRKWNEGISGL